MRPRLVVNSIPVPHDQELKEINVRLTTNDIRSENARAFYVEVLNNGRRTAQDVKPLVQISGRKVGWFPLVMIGPGITPDENIDWKKSEFQEYEAPFAEALIRHSSAGEHITSLYPKGLSKAFMLFFTLKSKNAAYIPSETYMSIPAPVQFRLELAFEAKDRPLHLSKTFMVFMRSWDSFDVVEDTQSRLQFLRKSS